MRRASKILAFNGKMDKSHLEVITLRGKVIMPTSLGLWEVQ